MDIIRIQITLKNGIKTMSERLSIEELKKIYGVTERTLNTWKKTKSLPLSKYPHNTNTSIKMI